MDELRNDSTRRLLASISQAGDPYRQQALALLALNAGHTQVEAGRRSGLTARQVRYIRDKFQQRGMEMFPDDVIGGVHSDRLSVSSESGLGGWSYETEEPAGSGDSPEESGIIPLDTQKEMPSGKPPKDKKVKKNKKNKKDKAGGKKNKKEKKKKRKKKTKTK